MDRNVVTRKDAERIKEAANRRRPTTSLEMGAQQGDGGLVLGNEAQDKADHVSPDRWYEKLTKYIPSEALSLYIALDSFVRGSFPNDGSLEIKNQLQVWLWISLVASALFNFLWLTRVWKVSRLSQLIVSSVALVVYIIALGGAFTASGLTTSFHGGFALIVTTAFLCFFEPPEKRVP